MNTKYTAIVFDFFDVLHQDAQKAWLKINGLKREGGFAEASDLLDSGVIDIKTYFERFAKHSGHPSDAIQREFAKSTLNPGMKKTIKRLHAHYKVGLLSNTATDEIMPLLDKYKLHDLFHTIVISSEVGLMKPDAAIFQLILARLGSRPQDTIFVDDNPVNVAAAEKLGITGVCFTDHDYFLKQLQSLGINPYSKEVYN